MLPWTEYGSGSLALVMMPFLGGTQREWTEVIELLSPNLRCITIDLPGFGAASEHPGYSVEEMCDAVIETLASLHLTRYVLVGHSMAGKVSAVVARRLLDSEAGVPPPAGLVLVAPSPPSPEPMPEAKRTEMLGLFTGLENSRYDAEKYVVENLYVEIYQEALERTIEDVLLLNRHAWKAWLESGSKEDWSEYVGILNLSVLIVAGNHDGALGPAAQRELTLPSFSASRLEVLNCNHLIPLERPSELASLIAEFTQALHIPSEYAYLIESPRVSLQTRTILLERAGADDPDYEPAVLTREQLHTLRSVLDRVIPQSGPTIIDLAARLDRQLASGKGDGWRYAVLPPDSEACVGGLTVLDELAQKLSGTPFEALNDTAKDSLLGAIAATRIASPKIDLTRWLEDLRANAAQLYVSHPQTLASIGYSGIADDPNGFVQIGIGMTEAWEPQPQ